MTRCVGRHGWVALLLLASCAATPPVPPPVPFHLTGDEQAGVDRLLARWEQWNAGLKTFDCRFKRWTYDGVFGQSDEPKSVELGTIKYAAPGPATFRVERTEKDGKEAPIEDARAEHWVFDGKSIWFYNAGRKQVAGYRLPPEYHDNRLVDGPLAFGFPYAPLSGLFALLGKRLPMPGHFPFAARAEELERQYYIRDVTPADWHGEICLEAYPRSAELACCCRKINIMFAARDMSPMALRIVQPNGKDYTTYQFFDVVVNDPKAPPDDAAFRPTVPPGWQKIAESSPAEAPRRPKDDRR